jgi:hypothetical protein
MNIINIPGAIFNLTYPKYIAYHNFIRVICHACLTARGFLTLIIYGEEQN